MIFKQSLLKRVKLLYAPVSGGPDEAINGNMAIWVGGDKNTLNLFKSVLDSISDSPSHIGSVGSGSIAK